MQLSSAEIHGLHRDAGIIRLEVSQAELLPKQFLISWLAVGYIPFFH